MNEAETIHEVRRRKPPATGPCRVILTLAYFSSLAFLSASGMALGEDPKAGPPAGGQTGAPAEGEEHPPPPARPAPSAEKPVPPATLSQLEECVLSLVNLDREAAGMAPLIARGDLSDAADGHSSQMASSGEVYHRSNFREGTPSESELVGENVGAGYNCEELHNGFMASAPHAENVMRHDFNFVGLGAVEGKDGMFFITQVFMRAPLPMRLDPVEVVVVELPPPLPPAPVAAVEETPAATVEPAAAPEGQLPAAPGSKVTGKTAAYILELMT